MVPRSHKDHQTSSSLAAVFRIATTRLENPRFEAGSCVSTNEKATLLSRSFKETPIETTAVLQEVGPAFVGTTVHGARPGNSMEHLSEAPGGDRTNDQTGQPSTDQYKRKRKRANDKKYRDKKKQRTAETEIELEMLKPKFAELEAEVQKSKAELKIYQRELETSKAKCAELEKSNVELKIWRDLNVQMAEKHTAMISNILPQILQREVRERTSDNTPAGIGEAALTAYHTPFYQSGIVPRLDGSTVRESFGMHQSRVLQAWEHSQPLDNTSAIREVALPVYHAPVHEFGIPIRSGSLTMTDSLGICQSGAPQRWARGNSSELSTPTHDLTIDDYLANDNGEIPGLKHQ
ncbi:unnamed protein product [Dovyalis caffra]|uniref:BZIP domain-containing protein n=1 Tax=Dovyalis caffra TaxID=77055 RepID=A0AAV1SBF4_9ROSI|nr:unnamed protein product [Dovyalis caffra]